MASKGTAATALRITAGDDVLVAVDFIPRSTPNGDQTLGRSEMGSDAAGDTTGATDGTGAVTGAVREIGSDREIGADRGIGAAWLGADDGWDGAARCEPMGAEWAGSIRPR